MAVILEAQNLRKVFDNGETRNEVIRGVNLQINQGEFVVIMGPSGSGKSTLLYLLSTMTEATEGTVRYNGEAITGKPDKLLSQLRRREFGFVFQTFNLFPVYTAAENVGVPLMLDGRKVDQARVEELLRSVGLEKVINQRPYQMSGGQQQRVAIARALMHDPKILFADEPTGSLDTVSGDQVLQILRKVVDQDGKTVVMVTHDPKVANMADRVIRVQDGQIIEERSGGQVNYA